MAAAFSQDSVLLYLRSRGGSVKNAELLLHFRIFIRDSPDRDKNRELFKRFVNSLATVQQIDGVSFVVLRRKFRGSLPEPSSRAPGKRSDASPANPHPGPAGRAGKLRHDPRLAAGIPGKEVLPAAGILNTNDVETVAQPPQNQQLLTRRGEARGPPAAQVERLISGQPQPLSQPPLSKLSQHVQGPAHASETRPGRRDPEQCKQVPAPSKGLTPPPQTLQQARLTPPPQAGLTPPPLQQARLTPPPLQQARLTPPPLQQARLTPPPQAGLTPPPQAGLTPPPLQQARRTPPPQAGLTPPPLQQARLTPPPQAGLTPPPQAGLTPPPQAGLTPPPLQHSRCHRHRKSYKSAVSHDDDDDDDDGGSGDEDTAVGAASAGPQPLGGATLSAWSPPGSASPAPCSSSSSSSGRKPQIYIQNVKGDQLPRPSLGPGPGPGPGPGCEDQSQPPGPWSSGPDPAEERTWLGPAWGPLEPSQRRALSSSQGSIFSPPAGAGSPGGLDGSLEELQSPAAEGDLRVQETLQRSRTRTPSGTPPSSARLHSDQQPWVRAWHRSTGHLLTEGGDSSSHASTFSPQLRKRPAEAARASGSLRRRMCLSLGADLDQLLQEETKRGGTEAARLNRLTLISSSLSLHQGLSTSSLSSCSTPPRCHSLTELGEGGGRSHSPTANAQEDDHGRQSLVPLEAREHAWLVKGAAGAWPHIYSLFREDSSLLNRRDFISGFTVLHWIAKHGDHRVLNTLWYGVEKAGLTFQVNARASSGHTPLHIAAIHGHKNIIRLLVHKFQADVRLRDLAGKRAWQYLGAAPLDVFQMLGAPPRAALSGQGGVGTLDADHPPSRRRRRHRLSSASPGHRPLAKVKRSSSLAAFLKHRSLNPGRAQIQTPI